MRVLHPSPETSQSGIPEFWSVPEAALPGPGRSGCCWVWEAPQWQQQGSGAAAQFGAAARAVTPLVPEQELSLALQPQLSPVLGSFAQQLGLDTL